MTNLPPHPSGFPYGWTTLPSKTIEYRLARGKSPAGEQMERAGATLRQRHSVSLEEIQDSPLPQGARERTRVAFTLAEVLITLGIIGVVAAMTIPTLMSKIQEKELYAAWKRVYSVLNQAYRLAAEEHGDYSGWAHTSTDDYEKIKPFLKIANDCPNGVNGKKCFPNVTYTCFNGDDPATCFGDGSWPHSSWRFSVKLLSGESIIFNKDDMNVNFVVDLNNNKKPNQIGVDMHYFSISQDNVSKEYTVYPGVGGRWNNQAQKCQRNVVSSRVGAGAWHPGSGCGFWILKHGNMDYLHMTDEQIAEQW